MQTSQLWTLDKAGKHILTVGLSTLILGLLAAYLIPGVGSPTSLNTWTVLAIMIGAMIAGLVTAHDKVANPIIHALIATGVASIVTSFLYQAWGQQFSAVMGIVAVGAFLSTLISKLWHGRKGNRSS